MSAEPAVKPRADARPQSAPPGGEPAHPLAPALEAVLLTLDRPVSLARLAEGLALAPPQADGGTDDPAPAVVVKAGRSPGEPSAADRLRAAIDELNAAYASTGRAFRIEHVAGGVRLMTLPAMAPVLAAFHKTRASTRLSRPAVETLSIIAYRQPITRAQLEAIRGVSCGEVLRSLLDRRLVTIKGRAEELGRPILYGTTREFLDAFGLASLKDLPSPAEVPGGAGAGV